MPTFRDIVGQEQMKDHLQNAILSKKISHAYAICGERFSGKEFVAKVFAQTLQCEKGGTDPCCQCHSCHQAESMNHPDIVFVTHEKAASIGVDDVREQLSNDVNIRPYNSPYKIYIIPEAEKMTPQAQNAILKTLEEPPEYVVIILLTTGMGSLLPTIRSRVVELDMKPVSSGVLKNYLMREMQIPDYKADVCVAYAQGNVGKAREMASSDEYEAVQKLTLTLVKDAKGMELAEIISQIKSMTEYKVNPSDFLDIISVWYRDVLLFKATGDGNQLVYRENLSFIRKIAQRSSYEGIEKILEAIQTAKTRIDANVNFELTMQLLFMTIQEHG